METKHLEKNIKDLTYSRIISWENTCLVLLGTAILTIIFSPEEKPLAISKVAWVLLLAPIAGVALLYFEKRTKRVLKEIKNLKE